MVSLLLFIKADFSMVFTEFGNVNDVIPVPGYGHQMQGRRFIIQVSGGGGHGFL